jgi:diguanylate cyclase (GGDEF)-like protein
VNRTSVGERIYGWGLVLGSLLLAATINLSLWPRDGLTMLYVLPLLVAARRLTPRAVGFATASALVVLTATIAGADTPWPLTLLGIAALLAVGYLAATLAHERTLATQRIAVAEARVAVAAQRTQEAEQLLEAGELLRVCASQVEVDAVVSQLMPRMFPGTAGAIFHLNAAGEELRRGGRWGSGSVDGRAQFAPADCWGLRRGQAHVVDAAHGGLTCAHVSPASRAYVCLPLTARSEILGVLHVSASTTDTAAGSLAPEQQRLAAVVGEQLALTLANLRLQALLRDEALHDPLTGLLNRRFLEEHLQRAVHQAVRARQPLTVVMLDIDRFKRFNDTCGHDAGDTLLRELGRLLQALFRGGDVACRYGGEEFLLVLPGASLADARDRAEQLRESVKQLLRPRATGSGEPVTVSLGVAVAPEHGTTPAALIAAADAALYRAKAAGRDRVAVAEADERLPEPGSPAAA